MIVLNSGIGNYIVSKGKRHSYFGGNNYLGLANHPDIIAAAVECINSYGVNFSASRRTTGTSDIHLELERELSVFKGKQDSVIFASGYLGNGILLETLKDRYSSLFYDEYAHPSITGNIPRDIVNVKPYKHSDPDHLAMLLERHSGSRPLIITDGVFPITGEIAPLDRIYPLVEKHHALLVVDDAHSTGILGKTGKGTPEHFNLPESDDIYQTETMSKALGCYGGFIAGNNELTDSIRDTSSAYQSSTALPPPIVAAGIAALKIIRKNPEMRTKLIEKSGKFKEEINSMGFHTNRDNTPVVPLILSDAARAINLSVFLEENGFIVPYVRYPVKMDMHILRISITVDHTTGQTENLLKLLKKWKDKNGKDKD